MDMKHTPGPWIAHDDPVIDPLNGHQYDVTAGPNPIASVYACAPMSDLDEVWSANARLIAAAPDLLDALQRIWEGSTGELDADGNDVGAIAAAAIAKATGAEVVA